MDWLIELNRPALLSVLRGNGVPCGDNSTNDELAEALVLRLRRLCEDAAEGDHVDSHLLAVAGQVARACPSHEFDVGARLRDALRACDRRCARREVDGAVLPWAPGKPLGQRPSLTTAYLRLDSVANLEHETNHPSRVPAGEPPEGAQRARGLQDQLPTIATDCQMRLGVDQCGAARVLECLSAECAHACPTNVNVSRDARARLCHAPLCAEPLQLADMVPYLLPLIGEGHAERLINREWECPGVRPDAKLAMHMFRRSMLKPTRTFSPSEETLDFCRSLPFFAPKLCQDPDVRRMLLSGGTWWPTHGASPRVRTRARACASRSARALRVWHSACQSRTHSREM